ncbi:hypothetical protein, partial [Desertihabitans aurantiacus]|uniref:hypothetical protein n=1 Tax=Desertihabitans aurantiacus TaxID=2282477 RepID=UPI001E2C41B8
MPVVPHRPAPPPEAQGWQEPVRWSQERPWRGVRLEPSRRPAPSGPGSPAPTLVMDRPSAPP